MQKSSEKRLLDAAQVRPVPHFSCLFCACQRRAERWEEPRLPGKKAAERGDPQKQGKHRRQSSHPPFPHRSHFLCTVMRFFHLSLPQADIGLRLRKNSVILCDVFGPGIPYPNVSAFKHAAFIREEGRHVLRRSQTGHGEGIRVPDRLPVPRDLRQGIRPVIILETTSCETEKKSLEAMRIYMWFSSTTGRTVSSRPTRSVLAGSL